MSADRQADRVRRGIFALVFALVIAGCDARGPADNGTVIAPSPTTAAALPAAVPTPSATRVAPGIDRIERVVPTPAPLPPPSEPMRPRKDFTDPPLPAELQDDGGLKPLPPAPRR